MSIASENTGASADGWVRSHSGKVRDLYRHDAHPGVVLLVASDRVSAFDHVLAPDIPGKGELLTRLSLWWFERLGLPDHRVPGGEALIPPRFEGRAMAVRELRMFPIECVVRGFLAGSAWSEYQRAGTAGGHPLPAGLAFGDRLPEPLYTPAWKAPQGQHDENISFKRTVELVGADAAAALRDASLGIYRTASAIAEARGILLADTKFEFGHGEDGSPVLADEVLTSDSSRYWDQDAWAEGRRHESFDKQVVRDWLSARWDGEGTPPTLPAEIVAKTAERYRSLADRLMSE